jgi:hypothetical protein
MFTIDNQQWSEMIIRFAGDLTTNNFILDTVATSAGFKVLAR